MYISWYLEHVVFGGRYIAPIRGSDPSRIRQETPTFAIIQRRTIKPESGRYHKYPKEHIVLCQKPIIQPGRSYIIPTISELTKSIR